MRTKEKIYISFTIFSLLASLLFLTAHNSLFVRVTGFLIFLFIADIFIFLNRYYIIECFTNAKYIINRLYQVKDDVKKYDEKVNERILKINELDMQIDKLDTEINEKNRQISLIDKQLSQRIDKLDFDVSLFAEFNMKYIDKMTGIEFEDFAKRLLILLGYTDVKKTKASNDYGVDILAQKDGLKYAIQCKNYSDTLGNKSIQEVYTGKKFYNCDVAIVFTNNYFTKNAIALAVTNEVLLWDRNVLEKLLKKAKINLISNK